MNNNVNLSHPFRKVKKMIRHNKKTDLNQIYRAIGGSALPAQALQPPEDETRLLLKFANLVDFWDGPVRQMLNRLGQTLWPTEYMLKLFPISHYRLRDKHISNRVHTWWVEHDIPPFDRYQCAAYQVYLALNKYNAPALSVQSGVKIYCVTPLTLKALETAITKAGQDPPLIIPRKRGRVKH